MSAGFLNLCPQKPCTRGARNVRKTNDRQLDIYDFILPFGGHLKADNRWVKLRKTINWELVEEEYCRNFANKDAGQEAYPADVAFGSLYIQRLLGFTDRELVDQIAENPYMQYFIGYKEYAILTAVSMLGSWLEKDWTKKWRQGG